MAVPKKKISKSRTGQRRSHDALKAVTYVENETTGEFTLPHHISPDGYYRGKQIIIPRQIDEEDETEAETL